MDNRYARQRVLKYIGKEGQEKLGASRAAIVGMGALGSVQANLLARAGVGSLYREGRRGECSQSLCSGGTAPAGEQCNRDRRSDHGPEQRECGSTAL